jgi:Domain of unknown function (DUF4159)
MLRRFREPAIALITGLVLISAPASATKAAVTSAEVQRAIRTGVRYLSSVQSRDGSWNGQPGTTALATLALLTAGEPVGSPAVSRALNHLRGLSPEAQNNTYAISLQTMAYAAADPSAYKIAITRNVDWLERTQIRTGAQVMAGPIQLRRMLNAGTGGWSYPMGAIDNSNTQYALLGLLAGSEAGIPVHHEVWAVARRYWEQCQQNDGGWNYKPVRGTSTGSMTCAGLSSLIITGLKRYQGHETLIGDTVQHCGEGEYDRRIQAALDWLGVHFSVRENPNSGQMWRYYFLYGLERAGRLTGQRFFGRHDWYREGAEVLVAEQDKLSGAWSSGGDAGPIVTTSFALLFLAKGRSPVLVNKLRHGPGADWNNDPDDIRNLVSLVSKDWEHLLTWQVVDPNAATVEDMLQAPIAYFNGHDSPLFNPAAEQNLREYVEQGGFIFAENCCGRLEFDLGFRALMKKIFPEPQFELHPLPEEHPVWRAKYLLTPEVHPLWGIEHGCRTVVIYSPADLSCFWNQMDSQPDNPAVIKAERVGQNVVDYATGREMPADKLDPHEITRSLVESPKRGALQIGKLRHGGDWNVAPLAIPNLTAALRDKLSFDVVINHRELLPSDPNLINYPLLYIHGRAALAFSPEDLAALRRHLEPGGGTIFADAACGSTAFDSSFRQFVAELLPNNPLVPIARDDDLYTRQVGYDLSDVEFSKAAGGNHGLPQLEGVKLNGHWAIIYSKLDIGCALEHPQGIECKGYTHESALRIAVNIVVYATRP